MSTDELWRIKKHQLRLRARKKEEWSCKKTKRNRNGHFSGNGLFEQKTCWSWHLLQNYAENVWNMRKILWVRKRVCVCVQVRGCERERERTVWEIDWERKRHWLRERERETELRFQEKHILGWITNDSSFNNTLSFKSMATGRRERGMLEGVRSKLLLLMAPQTFGPGVVGVGCIFLKRPLA